MTDYTDTVNETTIVDLPPESSSIPAVASQSSSTIEKVAVDLLDLQDSLYDTMAGNIAYYEATDALLERYLEGSGREWRHGWSISARLLEESQNELLRRLEAIRGELPD